MKKRALPLVVAVIAAGLWIAIFYIATAHLLDGI